VDHTHYPVLFALAAGPQRISDLAGCAHADVSTVSRQVTHLVHHGLLAKVADPDDGRAHRVSLTDDGRTVIDRTIAGRGEWLAAIMADWSDADARDFLHQLNRFADSLETAKVRFERTAR
jgi:DNA-binding MarR family transcriptional regulator